MNNLIPSSSGQGLGNSVFPWRHLYVGDDGIFASDLGKSIIVANLDISGMELDNLTPKELGIVYFCKRYDGASGIGTYSNPYIANNGYHIDHILRSYYASGIRNMTFIFHSGEYETYGAGDAGKDDNVSDTGTYGFNLLNGWTIKGQGPNITTLKNINTYTGAVGVFRCGDQNGISGCATNITISDMTIDCNLSNITTSTPLKTSCILGKFYDNIEFNNLKLINFGSNMQNNSAGIYYKCINNYNKRLYINNVYIDSPTGYGVGIILSGNNINTQNSGLFMSSGGFSTSISKFYIKGNGSACGIELHGFNNVNIYNGIIEQCLDGVQNKTSYNRSLKINNTLLYNNITSIYLGGNYTGQNINTSIRDCTFIIPQTGTGLYLAGNIFHSDFSNNFFAIMSGATSAYGINIHTGSSYSIYKNNSFYFNKFDSTLTNNAPSLDYTGNSIGIFGYNINSNGNRASGFNLNYSDDIFTFSGGHAYIN